MERQELNLDSQVFKNTIEQQNFIDILATLDHVTPQFISRNEFNNKKGNFLKKVGKDKYGDQFILLVANDIRIHEFPAIIKRVTEVIYTDSPPPQSSVNELKFKIETIYDILIKKLTQSYKKVKNKNESKNIQKAIKKYYSLYIKLGGKPNELQNSGNREKKPKIYENSNFYNHYTHFTKKTLVKTTSSLERLETSISQEIINHADEVFFEKGINMLYQGLETFTKANLTHSEQKKAKIRNRKNKILTEKIKKQKLDSQSRKLRKKLQIDSYKEKLKNARDKNKMQQVEQLEIEIVKKLLLILRTEYPYQLTSRNHGYQPSKILQSKELYCVGFSLVGHAFMTELGIKHNGLNIHNHSALEVIIGNRSYYFDGANKSHLGEMNKTTIDKQANRILYKVKDSQGKNQYLNTAIVGNAETILLSQIYNNRAGGLFNSKKYKQALHMYNMALNKDPYTSSFLSNKSNTLRILGRKKEALVAIKKSLQYNSNNAHAYFVEGIMLEGEISIQSLNTSLKINPESSYVYKTISEKLEKIGERSSSGLYKYVHQLIENEQGTPKPSSDQTEKIKILKLYKKGKYKEITKYLNSIRKNHQTLLKANLYYENKQYNKALTEYRKIGYSGRYKNNSYEFKGYSHMKLGEKTKGLNELYNALYVGVHSNKIYDSISRLLTVVGKKEQAKAYELVSYLTDKNNPKFSGKKFNSVKNWKLIVHLYKDGKDFRNINKYLLKKVSGK